MGLNIGVIEGDSRYLLATARTVTQTAGELCAQAGRSCRRARRLRATATQLRLARNGQRPGPPPAAQDAVEP